MGSPILKSDNREIQDFHLTTDIFQNTRDNKPHPDSVCIIHFQPPRPASSEGDSHRKKVTVSLSCRGLRGHCYADEGKDL